MAVQGIEKDGYYLINTGDSFDSKALLPVRELIDSALEKGLKNVVFDMTTCSYIDSSAIGLLASFHKRSKLAGGKVFILHPSDHVKQILEYANMDTLLGTYNTAEEIEKNLA